MKAFGQKIEDAIKTYTCAEDEAQITRKIQSILQEHVAKNSNEQVLKKILGLIDLTTLSVDDTEEKVIDMVEKVNAFKSHFPNFPNVAAICVYPALLPAVKHHLTAEGVEIAAVIGGFPASQTFIEVKVAETSLSMMSGATEGDMVISVGKFLSGEYGEVFDEVAELKSACGNAHLKVILETGALKTSENILKASIISLEAGADFLKTSTGKIPVAATLEATYTMCMAIKEFYNKSGKKIGFKAAGGIVTPEEAIEYYTLVEAILGETWMNAKLFRIGASRLANNILTQALGKETLYF